MAAGGRPVGRGSRKLLEPLALQSGARASAGSQLALLARGPPWRRELPWEGPESSQVCQGESSPGLFDITTSRAEPSSSAGWPPPAVAVSGLGYRGGPAVADVGGGPRLWWTERARRSRGRWAWPYRVTIGSDGIPASGTREATRAFEDLAVPDPDDEESERSPREKTFPPRGPPGRRPPERPRVPRAPRQGTESR